MGVFASTSNVVVQATEPASPNAGDIWRDTDANKLYTRNDANTAWLEITSGGFDETSIVVDHSTTEGDYTSPSAAVGTSEASMVQILSDDFTGTDDWTDSSPNDLMAVNISTDKMDMKWTGANANNNKSVYDLTDAISNHHWRIRFHKIRFSAISFGGRTSAYFGLSTGDQSVASSTAQDFLGIIFAQFGSAKYLRGAKADGAGISLIGAEQAFTAVIDTDYYLEIIRDNENSLSWTLYSDEWSTSVVSESALDITADTIEALRYLMIQSDTATGTGEIEGTTDKIELHQNGLDENAVDDYETSSLWQSDSEVNPAIYVDLGSNVNMCGLAIIPNANTTSTELKIRVSTDTSFADAENVRTISYSNLTEGSYNYIRFNVAVGRYLQVIGTDAAAKVLAINEIKVLTKTDAELSQNHGHLEISNSDTSIGLDGT